MSRSDGFEAMGHWLQVAIDRRQPAAPQHLPDCHRQQGKTHVSPVERLARRLPGQRVFITGAASGLGKALALEFARSGWRIGALDVSDHGLEQTAEDLEKCGATIVRHYRGSVSSETFVASALKDFAHQEGGVDVVINNAGVGVAGSFEVITPEDWRWIVDTNLLGVVWGCSAALPLMRKAQRGIILNIASAAGFASAPNMAPYNVTKAGVISLSETLAGEVAEAGIQVSCAMPGFFRSNLLRSLRAPQGERALGRQLLDHAAHDATEAAEAILEGVAGGSLYILWPREYALLWRLKRLAPRLFLYETRKLTEAQLLAEKSL
jgi:NAD(P)-dependent dehydrogenase (short-subunit alcohol dehydrogenase family)